MSGDTFMTEKKIHVSQNELSWGRKASKSEDKLGSLFLLGKIKLSAGLAQREKGVCG